MRIVDIKYEKPNFAHKAQYDWLVWVHADKNFPHGANIRLGDMRKVEGEWQFGNYPLGGNDEIFGYGRTRDAAVHDGLQSFIEHIQGVQDKRTLDVEKAKQDIQALQDADERGKALLQQLKNSGFFSPTQEATFDHILTWVNR